MLTSHNQKFKNSLVKHVTVIKYVPTSDLKICYCTKKKKKPGITVLTHLEGTTLAKAYARKIRGLNRIKYVGCKFYLDKSVKCNNRTKRYESNKLNVRINGDGTYAC